MPQLCFAGKIVATEHIVRESREEVLCGSSIALTKVRFFFLIWLGRCASGSLSPSGRDDLHMWDRWIRLHFRRSIEIGGIPRPMRRQSIARRRRIRGISTAFHHVREQRPRCCDASMHATLSSRCLAVHGKDPRLFRCIHQRRTQLLVRVKKGCGAVTDRTGEKLCCCLLLAFHRHLPLLSCGVVCFLVRRQGHCVGPRHWQGHGRVNLARKIRMCRLGSVRSGPLHSHGRPRDTRSQAPWGERWRAMVIPRCLLRRPYSASYDDVAI